MDVPIRELMDVAWDAASKAGALILDHWQQPKAIEYKGAIDLVTTTDRDSERIIVSTLRRAFPDHSILAEEETDQRQSATPYLWLVDPLDGTTNFAHGYPQFCVSIALQYNNNEIALGLVYDPVRDECFRAVRGLGATLNDRPIATSNSAELDKSLLATGFPYDRRDFADFYLTYFKAFMMRCQGIRRSGSAALDLCYVAAGRLDGFWELKLKPWDNAAGALMVTEAGGRLSDFSGDGFSIWSQETLASNRLIHDEMVYVARNITKLAR
ncbi:MAG TPA: inositol monophosphatase family protein [Terriglobales bacterium]|jgi:myo-inositol-1(or 4)-monophosphatase|nr:inositol monophosphatase family protein [Terriglobales bacterium]